MAIDLSDGVTVTVSMPQSAVSVVPVLVGPPGPAGPAGIPSGVAVRVVTPSASWVVPVPAGLGRIPAVSVFLDSGERVFPDVRADPNQVSCTFASPQTGYAILT